MMIYVLVLIYIFIVIKLLEKCYKHYCTLKELDNIIDDLKERNKTIERYLEKYQ
ncbi:hypothetical protein [Clostridium sp. CCUG 7971]|uniref:hypothetical protein n=1 Tax=Clostridium sp. CCUG 7971 TaxID=2811414 RepID=UPI001ABA8538|nr:hypothetical protein [Clostridium sp. CCUG 7971]MBO3446388.1 hypothetical protein [Clostridium sp. CCUG 7971]